MDKKIDILRTIQVQGHDLDIFGTANNPLFLANDVALLIDYNNGKVDQLEKASSPNTGENGRLRKSRCRRGAPHKSVFFIF